MQSSSRSRPFKSGLIGASPITDAKSWLNASCPRSSVRSERHRAEVEVVGAIPAVDTNFSPVPRQLQGEFRKLVWWPCASTRWESDQGAQPSLSEVRLGEPISKTINERKSHEACTPLPNPIALSQELQTGSFDPNPTGRKDDQSFSSDACWHGNEIFPE